MKYLLLLTLTCAFGFSKSALADQIQLNGQQTQFQMKLNSTAYRTEYRNEQVAKTCSREVFDGYSRECHQEGGGRTCYTTPDEEVCGLTPTGRECNTVPGHEVCENEPSQQVCRDIPQYRNEYYTCYETISTPYSVYDHDVENLVNIKVDQSKLTISGLNEILNVIQSGDLLNITPISTSGRVIIFKQITAQQVSSSGSLKHFNSNVILTPMSKQQVFGVFSQPASELSLSMSGATISVGQIQDINAIKISLFMERQRSLAKNVEIINRVLNNNEYTFTTNNGQSSIFVDFAKLGIQSKLSDIKINATISIQSVVNPNNIVNTKDIPSSLTIEKSVRKARL